MGEEMKDIDIDIDTDLSLKNKETNMGLTFRVSYSSVLNEGFPDDIDMVFSDDSDEDNYPCVSPKTVTPSSKELNEFELSQSEKNKFLNAQISHNNNMPKDSQFIKILNNLIDESNTLTKYICRQWLIRCTGNIDDDE